MYYVRFSLTYLPTPKSDILNERSLFRMDQIRCTNIIEGQLGPKKGKKGQKGQLFTLIEQHHHQNVSIDKIKIFTVS